MFPEVSTDRAGVAGAHRRRYAPGEVRVLRVLGALDTGGIEQLARVPVRRANFTSDGAGHPHKLRRRIQRSALRRMTSAFATHVTDVSPGALTHCCRPDWRSDRRCQVLPTGVDLDRLCQPGTANLRLEIAAAPEELLLPIVGRPIPTKRRGMVPAIVAQLGQAGIASRAVLVGPPGGDDDDRVRAAERHRVIERVHILGRREALGCLLRQADLLLQRLGGVSVIDPDAGPAQWALAIRAMGVIPGQRRDEAGARRAIEASVFSLDSAAAQHVALYTGA